MSNCKACGAGIWFITMRGTGKAMPVNDQPVPYVLTENGPGTYITEDGVAHKGRPWKKGEDEMYELGYVSHFATCPKAGAFRKKRVES